MTTPKELSLAEVKALEIGNRVILCGTDAEEPQRILELSAAHKRGIKTWVSFEPVVNAEKVLGILSDWHSIMDKVKIGKLNYHPSDINWKQFGKDAEALCQKLGLDYYIKDSLRAEMNKP